MHQNNPLFQEQKCPALKSPTIVFSACEPKAREGCLNRFHLVQTLLHVAFDSCGFALVTVTDCSDDLAVSRRPRQPHRCSGFPLTCFLASNLNQGEGARNSDEPLMAPLLSFALLARFIPVRHFKVPGFNLKNFTQIMSTIHFMSSTFKDIDIFKLISIRSTLQNRAVFVH